MRTSIPWLALLLAIVPAVSACDGTLSEEPATQSSLTGTWTLGHRQLSNDCRPDSDLFPMAPGPVDIHLTGDDITLTSRGEAPVTYTVDPQRWSRVRRQTVDGCDMSVEETWFLRESGESRLAATYESRVALAGDCEFTGLESCRVSYDVWGVRR
jgi:hypothetical protein